MGIKNYLNKMKASNNHLKEQIDKTKDKKLKKALEKRLKENESFEKSFGYIGYW